MIFYIQSILQYAMEHLVNQMENTGGVISMLVRANHALGGETKQYVKDVPAGDQFAGRRSADMDIYSDDFTEDECTVV